MNRRDFDASIRGAGTFLEELDLLDGTVYNCSLPRSSIFNELCLTSQDYVSIYETGLKLSHYNHVLNDLSYFQYSHVEEAEWALAFYPNPRLCGCPQALDFFRTCQEDRASDKITDEEFSELVFQIPPLIYVPRFRFEYSGSQYRPVKHPGGHVHIGMAGEDRWCSARKMSPNSFTMLMVRYFYPANWWPSSRFSRGSDQWGDPAIKAQCLDEQLSQSLRLDGASHHFDEFERDVLHFYSR